MLRISIPQPCHEKWEEMTPVDKGAYCNSCCKTVIDFTGMNDNEVLTYFTDRQGQQICGMFRNPQLYREDKLISPEILLMQIPLWKKYLALLFICFSELLTGCSPGNDKMMGTPISVKTENRNIAKTDITVFCELNKDEAAAKDENTKAKSEEIIVFKDDIEYRTLGMGYVTPAPEDYHFPYENGVIGKIFGSPKK
jgi:hypothetical protein